MIPANGSAITRCLAASCASAVSGSWRLNYRRSTAPPRESWMAQGFPSEAIHHALAAGDAKMLRDILLNHAWGMFNHSELGLLEQSLAALPWSNLLENPRLILLQAWLMQSQHRYSEVNTLLARAEQGDECGNGHRDAWRLQRAARAGGD